MTSLPEPTFQSKGAPDSPMMVLRNGVDVTDQPMSAPTYDPLGDAHTSLANTIAFCSRDWARDNRDAWIYGIVSGWCDGHAGTDCEGEWADGCALNDVARKHGWDAATIERMVRLRAAWLEAYGD